MTGDDRPMDYSGGAILRETQDALSACAGDGLALERAVIGIFFTGVKLDNGYAGICFTPVKEIPEAVCCPSSARAMPSAGRFKGRKVATVLKEMWRGGPLKKAVGIATMNALSAAHWAGHPPGGYAINRGVDAFDDLEIPGDARVAVVGALVPVLRMLKQRGKPFSILELDPRTLKPDELRYRVPPRRAPEAIGRSDILVVTGTTLINDTLEGILGRAKPGANVLLVGPTASMLPEAFFRRGVRSIGGIMATRADALLDVLAEGGSGYHFFGKSAERVVIEKVRD